MGVTLDVPSHVLETCRAQWDEAADKLDGCWRRLAKGATSDLAPEVAAAVETFQDAWVAEVKSIAGVAQANSDAFVRTAGDFQVTDRAQAVLLRGLLPWHYRDAPVRGR